MRFCCVRVGLSPLTGVLVRDRKGEDAETGGEGHGTTAWSIGPTSQGATRMTTDAGRGRKGPPQASQRECSPAYTLFLDFCPPEQ